MPVEIVVQITGLEELEAEFAAVPGVLQAEEEVAMGRATVIAEDEIKSLTPVRTGQLYAGWEAKIESIGGDPRATIADPVYYALFVEAGTGPHDIVANGNVLAFEGAGGTVFTKRVRNPGMRGRHMAKQGVENVKARIREEFVQAARRAVATLKGAR